jgi:hypothetical protein
MPFKELLPWAKLLLLCNFPQDTGAICPILSFATRFWDTRTPYLAEIVLENALLCDLRPIGRPFNFLS